MRAPVPILACLFGALVTASCQGGDPLAGRTICVDPGHGGTAETDTYRVGPTGEREEWIDLRVALMLRDILEKRGAKVLMTRTDDAAVELEDRAVLAIDNDADVFLSIHHNATADPGANFPVIYFHGNASENRASVALARTLGARLAEALFEGQTQVALVSDHAIFPTAGAAVLRHSYGIPGVIGEASFFTNPDEEQRLRDEEYNRREAEAYAAALTEFFSQPIPEILDKGSQVAIEPFEVLEEGGRMDSVALDWKKNWRAGQAAQEEGMPEALEEALQLFTLSARSFPDSWIAGDCHVRRAQILEPLGRSEEAAMARLRAEEHYVPLGAEFGILNSEF
jgi:N-acetylmuramoyl-L-alanine amidase